MADNTNVERKLGKIEVLALRDATGIVDNKIVGLFQDNTDLTYVYCHFPILENGSNMFWGCENLETFFTNSPEHVGILPNLENGSGMFYYTKLSEFATELPKMSNGSKMFLNCSNLKTFKSNLKALENYQEMFKDDKLNSFEANEINVTDTGVKFMNTSGLSNSYDSLANVDCNFPKMTDTSSMFKNFTALKTFKGNLNSLTNGTNMFNNCEKLETFTGSLPKLSIGKGMFYYTNLSEFTEDLPSLTDGGWDVNGSSTPGMFSYCKNLKKFSSNMGNLTTYSNMFDGTSLNIFKTNKINATETGANFMQNIGLVSSKATLNDFYCSFPNMLNTESMFKNFTALKTVKGDFIPAVDCNYMFAYCYSYNGETNVETGLEKVECNFSSAKNCESMFRGCKKLTNVNCTTYALQNAKHMFRDCSKLSQNNFNLDFFYNTLVDGLAMFQGTSFSSIPWNLPTLTRSKQMFSRTKISGHLSLDMTTQFPKVSTNNGEWADPASYMFSYCPITSIDFNVSSLDNGISMFAHCTQLTQCTGAKFQESGFYQSMFTESKFDQESAQLIFNYAKMANVAKLHIGIGFQLTEDHNFVKKNSLIKYSEDNSGRQWCEGYAYCHCHNVDEAAARDYLQQYGVTKHCHAKNAVTHYFDENPSIMFVCNPN